MCLEVMKAVVGLIFLLGDIFLVAACSFLQFSRGDFEGGTIHGSWMLALFYVAGFISNLFHYFIHEWQRQSYRSLSARAKCLLLLFIPCSFLLQWYGGRIRNPKSLTRRCWTSTLRLFYCTGTFLQAVLQAFMVVHLWWEPGIPFLNVSVAIVAAVFFSLHAIYGVCGYIWTAYYDETHTKLPALDYVLILAAVTLNIGGRVAAMSVVMATQGWFWLILAIESIFCFSHMTYFFQVSSNKTFASKVGLWFFLLPLGFLSATTVPEKRVSTIITTLIWLACSLPQIIMYHHALSEWLVWCIPASAQVIALVIMMGRWSVFEAAFESIRCLARNNQFTRVPNKELQLT